MKQKEHFPMELKILGLPKMTNTSRVHWSLIHKETKKWRHLVMTALDELDYFRQKAEPLKKAKLTLIRHSAREPDFDGLVSGFKRVIDALKACGVIEDDKPSVIGGSEFLWEKAKQGKGSITVRIEKL